MSGCNASFVFVLSLLVHPLFLEASRGGNGGGEMMMICSVKLERQKEPMVTRHRSRAPVSHLPLISPLVPEPNPLRV